MRATAAKLFWLSLICGLSVALGGCYETGSHRKSDGGGGNQHKTGDGGGDKPYGLALVDVFVPTKDVLLNPNCGAVPSSMADVRMDEIAQRVKRVTALISSQADNMRLVTTTLGDPNCADFTGIEYRAQRPLSDLQFDDSMKAKIALHVRLVIWFGGSDYRPYPGGQVVATQWADMKQLGAQGFQRILSVNHFAVTGDGYGYVQSWQRDLIDPTLSFPAKTVPTADPGDDSEIQGAVATSTTKFAKWLTREAKGL